MKKDQPNSFHLPYPQATIFLELNGAADASRLSGPLCRSLPSQRECPSSPPCSTHGMCSPAFSNHGIPHQTRLSLPSPFSEVDPPRRLSVLGRLSLPTVPAEFVATVLPPPLSPKAVEGPLPRGHGSALAAKPFLLSRTLFLPSVHSALQSVSPISSGCTRDPASGPYTRQHATFFDFSPPAKVSRCAICEVAMTDPGPPQEIRSSRIPLDTTSTSS